MTNRLYPGKPNYRGPKSGYFTLLHHEGPLMEWSANVMERVAYIKTDKHSDERPLRLRHIVFVPKKMQPQAVRDAYAKWQDAYAKSQDADAKWQDAYAKSQDAYAKWRDVCAKWRDAYAKWRDAYAKWRDAYAKWQDADAQKLLAYLHKHVKNCKWNGKEIVFK